MKISEFAERCGVSRVAIYGLLKRGRLHRDDSGGIDVKHPDVLQYIADRDVGLSDKHKPKAPTPQQKKNKTKKNVERRKPADIEIEHVDISDAANVAAMDSRELQDELTRQRVIELNLKNKQRSGDLLERDIVLDKFVYPMQDAFKKLVGDLAQTIPLKCYEIISNGGTVQDAQAETLKIINRAVGANVRKITKGVRDVVDN